MLLGGLQKTTFIDYPGKIAATVFTVGCPFRCPWCYSGEIVLPDKIEKQPQISDDYFFAFLKERVGLLDGVVICGGEPCIYEDLPVFCQKIKEMGYFVKLDTNGFNPEMLKLLIREELVDYVAMDIKAPLNDPKYKRAVGVKVDLSKIKKSIKTIKDSNIEYEFRTTVVPAFHTKEDILEIVSSISPAKRYYLQNFKPEKTINPELEKIKPYLEEYLLEIKKEISIFFEVCKVRGL